MNASLAHLATRPHVVYRCLSSDGTPIYVGCTSNLDQRMALHRSDPRSRRWLPLVDRIESETFPTLRAGRDAERELIQTLRPRFNSNHNRERAA